MMSYLFKVNKSSILLLAMVTMLLGCSTQPSNQAPLTNRLAASSSVTNPAEVVVEQPAQIVLTAIEIPNIDKKPVPVSDVWQRIRTGFQMDLINDNRRIQSQRNWYARHQNYLDRVTDRAERYLFHVVEELEKRDMPLELALLPIVESAFDPFAYSHGRASGMWQFIPGTGKRFGLAQNWWYDGRRDVVASTRAAMDYLSYLNKRFDGDWLLALAAYNSGEGNVRKAVKKNRRRNKATDFWSLDLPKETRAYVPKLIALAQLVNTPGKFNVSFQPVANKAYFAQINTDSQIDLAQAAELAEITLDELYLLNPGFNQWATAPDGPHWLNVPVDNANLFEENLLQLPANKRVRWERYTIRSGDSLIKIANRFQTTASALRNINNLNNNKIRAGHVLFIPVASKATEHYALSASQRLISKQQAPAKSGKTKIVHTTRSGDSFWKISRQYGVGMRELARWNSMGTTERLRIGQKLVIWTKPQQVASNASPAADRKIIRQVGYRVRSGDSLARIAQKFNVSIAQIESWNGINRKKYLQPGQSLKLYVDITRASL